MIRKLFNGVWVTEMQSPDGATAQVADHGAHLLSWKPTGGKDALYLSKCSKYGGNSAIRGGVPIIFPQFGERGSGQRHGFARLLNWHQEFAGIEQERAIARYSLDSDSAMDCGWPHQFKLLYEVAFAEAQLHLSLTVHNLSDHAWEFGAALHTYLQISDLDQIGIDGLQHIRYIDQTQSGAEAVQDTASLQIDAEIDRIYMDVSQPIVLSDAARTVMLEKQGFRDAVVWNPGLEKAGQLADMAPTDYRAFVCVEAGAVAKQVTLAPGERWTGCQSLMVKNNAQG